MKALIIAVSLLLVIVHIWISRQWHNGPNEKILAESVQSNLTNDFGNVTIDFQYLDGTVKGTVATKEIKKLVEERVNELQPASRIINKLELINLPASLLIQLKNNKLTLIGSVPNPKIRHQIGLSASKATRETNATIFNLIKVDSQTNSEWLATTPEFVAKFFENTEYCELEITGKRVRLKQSLRAAAKKKQFLKMVQHWQLPIVDEILLIRDQPEQLLAILDNGLISLTGQVPNESIKSSLGEQAKRSGYQINNRLTVREDVIEPRWKLNGFIGNYFKDVHKAELEISPETVRIARSVDKMRTKVELIENAKNLMPNAKLDEQLTFSKGSDFNFVFNRQNKELNLSGWLPTGKLKKNLIAATQAKYPNFSVNGDQLYVNPNVNTPEWITSIPQYINKLPEWKGWDQFRLSHAGLDWSGMTDHAKRNFGFTPEWFKKGFPKLEVPPLPPSKPLTLFVSLNNGSVILRGNLPDKTTEKSILTVIEGVAADLPLDNKVNVDPSSVIKPKWSADIAPLLTDLFANTPKQAEFEISSEKVRLKRGFLKKKQKDALLSKAETIKTANHIVDQLTVITGDNPSQKPTLPANLLAILDNKSISLTGTLHSKEAENAIFEAIKKAMPNVNISNNITIDSANVRVPLWSSSIAPILGDFFSENPPTAELEIDEKYLRLKRNVANKEEKDRITTKAKLILSNDNQFIDELTISPPTPNKPPELLAKLDKQKVILSGRLNSKIESQLLVKRITQALPNTILINNIQIDPMVKRSVWESTFPEFAATFLIKADTAELEISPNKFRLKKQVPSKGRKSYWLQQAQKLVSKEKLIDQITVKEVATVKPKPAPQYEKKLKNYVIYFDTNSTWIKEAEQEKMREAAELIKAFKNENRRLLIKGYADSRGEEAHNKRLSEGRALSVLGLLTGIGVDESSIDIIAVGESEAGNSYDEDRRVEVILVK